MFANLENGLGLDVVIWLQSMSHPLLDALAWALNIAGSSTVYIVIVLLVYYSLDRRIGIRLAMAVIVAGALTYLGKEALQRPRPFDISDQIMPLFLSGSSGIPSGHVLGAIVFGGSIAAAVQRRWLTAGVVVYVILMAWARMYAGVHYPQDVVIGAFIGSMTLILLLRYGDTLSSQWNRLHPYARASLLVLFGIALAVALAHDPDGLTTAGILIGMGPALALENHFIRFRVDGSVTVRLMRYIIGVVVVLAVMFGLRMLNDSGNPELFRLFRYALTALTAFFIWPWLGMHLGLFTRTTPEPDQSR